MKATFAAIALLPLALFAADEQLVPIKPRSADRVDRVLADLQAASGKSRASTFEQILHEHKRLVDGLIVIAETPKSHYEFNDSRDLAITLLQEFGTRKAIHAFIKNVDWKSPKSPPSMERDGFSHYPFAQALARFGPSAHKPILRYLAGTPAKKVPSAAVNQFALIIGIDEEAISLVQKELTNLRRDAHKENLVRLLERQKEIAKLEP